MAELTKEQLEYIKKCWPNAWAIKDHEHRELIKDYEPNSPRGYYNPDCKHERCNWDIFECKKCIEYTKQRIAENGTTSPTI